MNFEGLNAVKNELKELLDNGKYKKKPDQLETDLINAIKNAEPKFEGEIQKALNNLHLGFR